MAFETGSDNEKIDELQRQVDDIIDSQLTSVGGNEALSIDSTLGSRNAAIGDAGGVRSNQPIIHNITENDASGTPTGVFDKINLISSMIIVDHTSTPIDLRFIQGPAKEGSKIKITVKKDKVLVIKSGGNILTSSDITISDNEFYILVKHSEAETGISGGAYKILLTGTGGGGGISFPIDFPEDDRGTVGASTQDILFTNSDRHSVKMVISGDVALAFSSPPTNETAYTNIIIVQDGTGGHTLTLPAGTVNKDIVEAGFLTGIDEETGIVVKFAFGIFYAFLETGNIVSGGSPVSDWANFTAVSDVNFGTFDGINVDRFLFSVDAASFANDFDTGFVRNSNGLLANVDFEKSHFWSAAKTTIMSLEQETTSNNSILSVLATPDGSIPKIRTFALDSTPTVGTDIVNLDFLALNSAAANVVYAGIQAEIENTTSTLEEGSLSLNARAGGSQIPFIVLNNLADGKISAFRNILMDTGRDIELSGNDIFFDAGTTTKFSGTGSGITTTVNSVNVSVFTEVALTLQANVDFISRGVQVTPTTATFLLDGFISYSSTLNKFQFRENGVTVDLGGTPNAISQLDSNVTVTDSGSNGLIQFTADGVLIAQIQNNRMDFQTTPVFGITTITFDPLQTIAATATGIVMNFPDTNDTFDLQFNTADAFRVDNIKTLISSTVPNTASALLQLFRDDPSPVVDDVVSEVQFRGNDTAIVQNNIVYGKIGVEIEDAGETTSTGSFQWTVRNLALDQQMMSLKDGVLGVSRDSLTLPASSGAALVLVRNDTGLAIGDEAGELDFNINDGTERVFGNMSVTFDNTAVGDDSSRMDFKLLTDDVLQTILTLRGSAITDNKISIEVGADSFIKASTGVMGYFVTNDPAITDSIGDNGTSQIPQFSQGGASLAQLNAAFGAFDGVIGQDIADGRLYVRKNSTTYSFYSESGTVT